MKWLINSNNSQILSLPSIDDEKKKFEILQLWQKSFTMDSKNLKIILIWLFVMKLQFDFQKIFYHSMNLFCYKNSCFLLIIMNSWKYYFQWNRFTKIFWKLINPASDNYNIIPDFEFVDFTTNNFYEFEKAHEMRECLSMDQERLDEQIKFIKNQASKSNCLLVLTDRVSETDNFYQKLSNSQEFFVFTMTWTSLKDKTDQENIENAKISWKK